MSRHPLSVDDVGLLGRIMGRSVGPYTGTHLVVAPQDEEEVAALLANPDWRSLPAPQPVPEEIEFRQLVIGALLEGWISPEEAEAWAARNALPGVVLEAIALLPHEQQPIARITALTRERIKRSDPLIATAATVQMPTSTDAQRAAEGDRLFAAWAAL